MKKRIGRFAAALCICLIFLTGCGEAKMPETVDSQTIFISKEGQITLWLVMELMGAGDYELSELTQMAVEEAAQFNEGRTQGAAVAVEKVEALANGNAAVTYKFDNWKNCTEFIGNDLFYGTNELFYGTVIEAIAAGYGSKVIMKSVKDNTLFTEEQLRQAVDKYLIVTDVKANVYCPGRVAYLSDGAVVNEDGSVSTFGVEGLAYILLK